jgi:hypothetical protein
LGHRAGARLSVLEALPRLALAVLEHLIAYGELLYEEGVEAAQRLRRSLVGFAVAAVAAFIALELACLWVIAATWNGPNRLTAVGSLCIGFALIAVIGTAYASGARTSAEHRPFERVREEWRADMEELAALDPRLSGSGDSSVGAQNGRGGE